MINLEGLTQLQTYLKRPSSSLIQVLENPRLIDTLNLSPGDKIEAQVVTSQGNGRFTVKIKDQLLDLNLPRNTQPGEKLDLTVVTTRPQLSFSMSREAIGSALSKQDVNQVKFSQAANLLSALRQAQEGEQSSATRMVDSARLARLTLTPSTAPLMPEGVKLTQAAQLAQTLQTVVNESGLFYESHQLEWLAGDRTLADLMKEPQAQLSPKLLLQQVLQQAVEHEQQTQPKALASPADESDQTAKALQTKTGLASGQTVLVADNSPDNVSNPRAASAHPAATAAQINPAVLLQQLLGDAPPEEPGLQLAKLQQAFQSKDSIHPNAQPLVQQQLNLLDNQPLMWQGQIWPQQSMKWWIEEDTVDEREAEGEGDEHRTWQTKIALDLPNMGKLEVIAQLSSKGTALRFSVEKEETVQRILGEQVRLEGALAAAGVPLLQTLVSQDLKAE